MGAPATSFLQSVRRPERWTLCTTPKGESLETTARWQGSQLVVVTQRANGGKLVQTYTLDQGAGHMIISTQLTGQRLDRPIELRFVYDAEVER
jgi:hypothetical protein